MNLTMRLDTDVIASRRKAARRSSLVWIASSAFGLLAMTG